MSRIWTVAHGSWSKAPELETASAATDAVERGCVLFFPNLGFVIEPPEQRIFSPAILSSSKNASFDPASGRVGGTTLEREDRSRLQGLMSRFSDNAASLTSSLFPRYRGRIQRARTSFRPAEIAGRQTSWRQDDTRLHVDSFPASPVQGRRILRVFTNVNPSARPRSWRVGEDFHTIAERYAPMLSLPWPGTGVLLSLIRMTKSRRSPYDALMLQLHDRMKEDAHFQSSSGQEAVDFPSGSTWIAFTDQVSHAAMAGQYQLEQTFLLPIDAMIDEKRSPLRILEKLKGRSLIS